jgi:hypothetical protein
VNATEASELLALMALYDNRKASDPDIVAWLKVIGDLGYGDCEAAVIAHYQESRERIMPADVRVRVKAMRRDRLAREILPAPTAELADKPGPYLAVLRAGIRRIADGFSIRRAIEQRPRGLPPGVAEVRKALGPAIPSADRHLPPEEIARRQVAESRAARAAAVTPEPGNAEPAA